MTESHENVRLEAFCDGVFAIAMTLLIIDVKLPATDALHTNADVWNAVYHLLPTIVAFLLSFGIILITWVNHHAALRLVHKSSTSFYYANGFLLLTIVAIPLTTSLLGEFVLTDHAGPAVVLYDGVLAVQAVAWLSVMGSAIKNRLIDEKHLASTQESRRSGYFALVLYSLLALAGYWFPLAAAVVTTLTFISWLALSVRLNRG